MNLGSIFNFVIRRLVGRAVNAGISRALSGGRDPRDMTPEERQQYRASRQTVRRVRQVTRLARRVTGR
jgi:hypothetical protein